MALPSLPGFNGIALAAGAGGLELGVSLAVQGHRTVCWVERDAYASAALVARMGDKALHDAPVWSDLATFDGRPWRGKVDILTAGYPCQPFSQAGKRLGEKDPRHLWPHVRRILDETGARLLVVENVQGHVTLGLESVWRDLHAMGFEVQAGIFSAAEIGAPHIRKRLFLLAYADHESVRDVAASVLAGGQIDITGKRLSTRDAHCGESLDPALLDGDGKSPGLFPPDAGDFTAWDSWLAAQPGMQPAIPRSADGLAYPMDRYRLAGNGVCPLAAAYALATLSFSACPEIAA